METLKSFLYFRKWNFLAQAQKLKKICPEKISIPNIKKLSVKHFLKRKLSYISGNENSEKISHIFSKGSCSYISEKRNPEKISYVSGNVKLKKRFLFQEVTFRA